MTKSYRLARVRLNEMTDVLRVRQVVQGTAVALDLGSFQRTPIATASVEMARNAVMHAKSGVFTLDLSMTEEGALLTVTTRDQGDGIPREMIDIAHDRRATRVQSEGGGLGLGLRGIARLADKFGIDTDETGSVVTAGFRVDDSTPVNVLAKRIGEELAKLDTADRASALAEQNKDLLQALSERDLMLKEIHHRTQNNLTLINSLVRLREAAAESDAVKAALSDVSNRIQSIALVHSQLQKTEGLDNLELLPFLQLIVDQMTEALSTGQPVEAKVTGANPLVSARQAVDLGLLVGELVTNSIKHAFESQPDPRIAIEIGADDQKLELVICDNGRGLSEETLESADKSSLGWRVIRSIPPKYDGTLEITNRDGLWVIVNCRLDNIGY